MPKRATVPDAEKEIARYLAETLENNVADPEDINAQVCTVAVGVSFLAKAGLSDESVRFTAEAIVLTGAPESTKILSMKQMPVIREWAHPDARARAKDRTKP
ncbi:MAG: hypothetical protein KGJ23_08090 [Euryarchaeota archaeon]|nr:hypothetical protein [Euryarchaeota archaeon]MDE1836561.1 hypothetical protein [Euryarchaeota archaeon]MDE1879244.1 hypothetical protein [Euryarchaeota archaeon]MDE2044531.1 hypothetical protein [Thermoplasmata archaeon]